MKKTAALLVCVAVVLAGIVFLAVTGKINRKSENTTTTKNETSTISVSEDSTSEYSSTTERIDATESTTESTVQTTTSETSVTTEKTVISTSFTSSTTRSTTSTVKTTSKPAVTQKKATHPTYINGILITNKTYALPADYNPGVDPAAQKAVDEMIAAAKQDGIGLWVRSGFRSYSYQANLYNNYVARDGKSKADTYSARPGHSEHQTGLAFDLNSLSTSFANTPEGKWLAANCWKYGFIIRYPKGKESITGYQYEPWHVRYLGKDTAQSVYNSGLTLEEYLGITSKYSY